MPTGGKNESNSGDRRDWVADPQAATRFRQGLEASHGEKELDGGFHWILFFRQTHSGVDTQHATRDVR